MKQHITLTGLVLSLFALACSSSRSVHAGLPPYVPESKELYDTIVRMDSLFFDAYNTCKLNVMEVLLADNLEFYHDRGGLDTSKQDLLTGLKNNICGKVTRALLPGSIEVYPIPGYGAVQMGVHRFHNNQEPPDAPFHYSKFVHTWRRDNGQWKLARVISLH